MLSSKRGAAILQVLLIAALLAGISTMLLRSSLSRTASARQTRRTIAAQFEIENCMAQITQLWAIKSPEAFTRDLNDCIFYCRSVSGGVVSFGNPCPEASRVTEYKCGYKFFSNNTSYRLPHRIYAYMTGTNGNCKIKYEIQDAQDL